MPLHASFKSRMFNSFAGPKTSFADGTDRHLFYECGPTATFRARLRTWNSISATFQILTVLLICSSQIDRRMSHTDRAFHRTASPYRWTGFLNPVFAMHIRTGGLRHCLCLVHYQPERLALTLFIFKPCYPSYRVSPYRDSTRLYGGRHHLTLGLSAED